MPNDLIKHSVALATTQRRLDYIYSDKDYSRVAEYLRMSVGRVALNHAQKTGSALELKRAEISHIADWLKASIITDQEWLKKVDDQGRPKKLMKFSTIEQITHEADKAMLKASQSMRSVRTLASDETLVCELEDGFYVVQMLTPRALDRESALMQHCIGDGAYDEALIMTDDRFLSLRDPSGKPHATLQVSGRHLYQLQGKQNSRPLPKYLSKLTPFLRENIDCNSYSVQEMGYIVDEDGGWHSFDQMPETLTVIGPLMLRGDRVKSLPDRIIVKSDFSLSHNSKITRLPSGMTVFGSLTVRNTQVRDLPAIMTVQGNVTLASNRIKELPEGFHVCGNLTLREPLLKKLPKGLKVGGALNVLNNTELSELPENLVVDGDLHINGTSINALPYGCIVGGNVYSDEGQIQAIGDNVHVGGGINLGHEKSAAQRPVEATLAFSA
jgi:hypothetical protein